MLEHWETLIRKAMATHEDIMRLFAAFGSREPVVQVLEQAKGLKLVVEAPDNGKLEPHRWFVRVADQTVYLRGRLEQQQAIRNDYGPVYQEMQA